MTTNTNDANKYSALVKAVGLERGERIYSLVYGELNYIPGSTPYFKLSYHWVAERSVLDSKPGVINEITYKIVNTDVLFNKTLDPLNLIGNGHKHVAILWSKVGKDSYFSRVKTSETPFGERNQDLKALLRAFVMAET